MYLTLILILIFAACVAFMVGGGLWTNSLVLINTVTAGLIAFNYFEPLAGWLQKQMPSYTYFWDFLSLWGVFAIAIALMRTATDLLSKVKVKFRKPVETAGGIFMACSVGAVMVSFSLATLHTAPLAHNFLDGEFQPQPNSRMFMGLAPDRKWLNFVKMESRRSYYHGAAFSFGLVDDFVQRYAQRRANFEKELENRVGK